MDPSEDASLDGEQRMGERRPRYVEPGFKPFALGGLLGAVVLPAPMTRAQTSRLLPGVSGRGEALATCCLVGLAVAGIACLCFLLGRKVLEQRRLPPRWQLPLWGFLFLGAAVPAAFMGAIAFTD